MKQSLLQFDPTSSSKLNHKCRWIIKWMQSQSWSLIIMIKSSLTFCGVKFSISVPTCRKQFVRCYYASLKCPAMKWLLRPHPTVLPEAVNTLFQHAIQVQLHDTSFYHTLARNRSWPYPSKCWASTIYQHSATGWGNPSNLECCSATASVTASSCASFVTRC